MLAAETERDVIGHVGSKALDITKVMWYSISDNL